MANTIKGVVSLGSSLLRPTRGLIAVGHRKLPKKTLVLYEAEYCPYCRYVREALTALDLDALIYPIPKKGNRFREQLVAAAGKAQVPFLIDPNTGAKLHESEAIVKHLYEEYGPKGAKIPPLGIKSSLNATLLRGGKGMFANPGTAPKKPLELYSFEASPFARLVRETLCELELPFLLHNVGKAPGKAGRVAATEDTAGPRLCPGNQKPQAAGRARRQGYDTVPGRPQHRHRHVRVRRYPALPAQNLWLLNH